MQTTKQIMYKKYMDGIASGHPLTHFYAYLLGYISKSEFQTINAQKKTPTKVRVL